MKNETLSHYSAQIEEKLSQLLPEQNVPYCSLLTAARYSVLGGGKRLRPLLLLATATTLGAPLSHSLQPACALELIHTYSLIHDDLPCMDDDAFRRGKPSLHKAFPEGHAVLTGDFLLTYAFDLLANDPHLTPLQKIQLISTVSRHGGAAGMIGGQVMDIESEGKQLDLASLQAIHSYKTGALLTAAIECGGIVANLQEDKRPILTRFGEKIGLAFQIIDDILDANDSSDSTHEKATYVSLKGIPQSRQFAEELLNAALNELKKLNVDASLLQELAHLMVHRTH